MSKHFLKSTISNYFIELNNIYFKCAKYILYNFPNIQPFSVFLVQKDSCDHDNTDAFLFFLLEKNFCVCLWPFFALFLFIPQEGFSTFHLFLCEAFLCFFDNIY